MPQKLSSFFKFLFLALLVLSINSCLKEDFNVKNFGLYNASPGLAIPLINSNLTLRDVYNFDSSGWKLKEDNTNFLSLLYKKTETFGADSFLRISDQSLAKQKYIFKIDNTIPIGDSISDIYITNLDFVSSDNDIYDTLYIKSGSLIITINSTLNMNGNLIFSLPEATKDGKELVSKIEYKRKPIIDTLDLSGYKFVFAHQGNSNIVTTVCKVIAYNSGAKNNSPYEVNISITLNNIKFSKLYGYFSSRTFNFFDFLSVSLFRNIKKGDSYIEDPSLKLLISNSVGIPVKLDILSFISHSDIKTPHDLLITGLPKIINIPSPSKPGNVTYVDYLLNKSNSNLRDAINLSPTGFLYNVNGTTMPIRAIQNFIFEDSRIDLDVEIELPLFGWMKNFIMQDTFDFKIDNLENIESLTFNLIIDNGFPLEANIQMYFLDSNTIMLDSMFVNPQNFLRSALIDVPTGKVIKPVSRLYTIFFDKKRVKNLIKCRQIAFKASMYSSNKGKNSIKIYSNYGLALKLSALAKIKTN